MIANYHTHTWRCLHASGTERAYVEAAIEGGLKILGFSDHTPMPYDYGYVSPSKMRMDQLEDYVDTILALRSAYRDDIDIRLGLEVEYYPRYFTHLTEFLDQYPIEYFLLGQHFNHDEIGEKFNAIPTDSEEKLRCYCDQVIEAMETGRFAYVAHPDLLNYTGSPQVYDRHMRRLCERAKMLDIPLEINFLGIWDERSYPNPRFWQIAGQVGNTAVFGADAHTPDKVYNPSAEESAKKIAQANHLKVIETLILQ